MWSRKYILFAIALAGLTVGCTRPHKPEAYNAFTLPEATPAPAATPAAPTAPRPLMAPALPTHAPDDLVVGSWNIKWFGRSTPTQYDFVTMADFVEECDVVAVQELSGKNYAACMQELADELTARGGNYVYQISPETGYIDNPLVGHNDYVERYGFIWNADRLSLKGAPAFVSSPPINNTTYRQVPFVADFKTTGGDGFDFRLMSVHTVYNKDINAVREAEITAIRNWIVSESQGSEKDVIAIGDFNANPDGQPHHFADLIPDESLFRVLWYESRDAGEIPIRTTVPTKDASPDPDYFRKPVYDQMLVSNAASEALPATHMTRAAGQMGVYAFDDDPWWKENDWTRAEIIKAVSDHRPVWFKMDYNAADLD